MSNCKDIEDQIIAYVEGTLTASDEAMVKQRIESCEHCQQLEHEYRLLFTSIEDDVAELPSANLRNSFEAALREEVSDQKHISDSRHANIFQRSLPSIYKAAAVVALLFGSYWFGSYTTKKEYIPELTDLATQQQQLKRIAALSLFENESASKRIQAVTYSQELENADNDILNALIDKMLSDKLVNVRLAAARALKRFSEENMVKDAYLEAIKTEANASMLIELIEILAHIKETRAIPKMKELLHDDRTPLFIKDQLKTELQHLI